jgi:hypothetical protein
MSNIVVVPASPDQECCCCFTSGVLLHKMTKPDVSFRPGPPLPHDYHQHCDVCYETLIGRFCGQGSRESIALQCMAACTNIILKKLPP